MRTWEPTAVRGKSQERRPPSQQKLLGRCRWLADDGRMNVRRLAEWWRLLPLKMLWGIVILTAFVMPGLMRGMAKPGEFYPFSNFPMYSRFSASTYYVYVTDLEDQPVAVTTLTGKVLSNLKKQYESELKKLKAEAGGEMRVDTMPVEMRALAGETVLRWLVPFAHAEPLAKLGGLRLKQVNITWDDDEIKKETLAVGEYRLP